MEISNPRRILAVSLEDSAHVLSSVIQDLTGTPVSSAASLAGTTHPLRLTTPYYAATVPIWLDLAPLPAEWSASFLSAEAREVLAALGGLVAVFDASAPPSAASAARGLVEGVGRVAREGLGGWEWDGVGLAVGVGGEEGDDEVVGAWEDVCGECGLEFAHVPALGARKGKGGGDDEEERRNEFGEKVGIARVLEALQANDWSQADDTGLDEDGDDDEDIDEEFGDYAAVDLADAAGRQGEKTSGRDSSPEFDPEKLDFGFDKDDFVGLRKAIWNAGREEDNDEGFMNGVDAEGSTLRKGASEEKEATGKVKEAEDEQLRESDVRKLDVMMKKLLAVRDMSAGLPEEQRKRMAKQAVGEVMREL